ncbi:MAG: hypothetical protein RI575_10535 [Balneolaceae bacterium]|nr:hypothetical protein [Balneolaceae bacterium]MDR9410500.1 hypothetical protein [Balneolaceae bacterium]
MRKLFHLFYINIFLLLFFGCIIESDSEPKIYPLNTYSRPIPGGTTTPVQGDYEEGEQVELTASSNENWVFKG